MNSGSRTPLRVLHIEDNEDDSLLIARTLRKSFDLDILRVDCAEKMSAVVGHKAFDLIVCDYNLPGFSPFDALRIAQDLDYDLPCIVLSGSISEAEAVALMDKGARDYLSKASLDRLVPAIRRELRDARVRRDLLESTRAVAEARIIAGEAEKRAVLADELAQANQELRDTQSQLIQSAKMASLGLLVAGVAHEINNPLGFSMSHLSTVVKLLDELSDDVEGAKNLAKFRKAQDRIVSVRDGLSRVEELVRKLRVFARQDEAEMKPADIREGIESTLVLLNHRIPRGVTIGCDYCDDNEIYCSPSSINQVVMNLVTNALDAVGDSGRIDILTTRSGDEFSLRVRDSGPGIPKEVQERIFEPFFTTKDVGHGMGLGLAICYRIVERHRGRIEIFSSENCGCEFVVTLPARQDGT